MNAGAPTVTVVSCIIERGRRDEVLICRPRSDDDDAPATWEFPTGVKEARESHEAAMRRVCRQRVGLTIAIHTGQPPLTADYRGGPAVYRFFLASVKTGEARPADYESVRWVQVGQLCEYDFDKTFQDVVDWYVG